MSAALKIRNIKEDLAKRKQAIAYKLLLLLL